MGTSYDSELNANQIKRIGSALDASGLFKETEPRIRIPAGSDLIWISIRYDGVTATWDELLAPDAAEKLLAEIVTVLEKVK